MRRILIRGLPKMRNHDLRHRVAAILIAHGVSASAIGEVLGDPGPGTSLGAQL
jgi:integrase